MGAPRGVSCTVVPVAFADPNDVSPWQLLQFEWRQRKVVRRLLESEQFDVVHRVTPSGWKDSLLPVPTVPLILGPILLSEPAPAEFEAVFRPRLPRERSLGAVVRRFQNGFARRVFRRWSTAGRLLEHAAAILVGTRTTLQRLPPRLHGRCRLITYAGVEHDVYRPAARKRSNRVPQLLFVGRKVPYKGVELLLRAAARAKRSCRFELKIVGRGSAPYRKYCETLAGTLGLSDSVCFIDGQPRSTLVDLYRQADVFCMPSIETYGISILEAMSSGCAVLVSDINGPGDIVQADCGVKVPLESPEQFVRDYADQLTALIEDAPRRGELGARARQRAVSHHNWPRIQQELVDIYDNLLPVRRAPSLDESPHIVAVTP